MEKFSLVHDPCFSKTSTMATMCTMYGYHHQQPSSFNEIQQVGVTLTLSFPLRTQTPHLCQCQQVGIIFHFRLTSSRRGYFKLKITYTNCKDKKKKKSRCWNNHQHVPPNSLSNNLFLFSSSYILNPPTGQILPSPNSQFSSRRRSMTISHNSKTLIKIFPSYM